MELWLVTGVSGSGKSAVSRELARRGHTAVDGDASLADWVDSAGRVVDRPEAADADLYANHAWQWDSAPLARLAEDRGGERVFVCGNAANDGDVLHLFEVMVLRWVDEHTMLRRVADPDRDSDFGRNPVEREQLIRYRPRTHARWMAAGAVIIDATRALTDVVDEICAIKVNGIGPGRRIVAAMASEDHDPCPGADVVADRRRVRAAS
jgi:hypothetical protein